MYLIVVILSYSISQGSLRHRLSFGTPADWEKRPGCLSRRYGQEMRLKRTRTWVFHWPQYGRNLTLQFCNRNVNQGYQASDFVHGVVTAL
jgi:hypothetical protein